MFKVLTGKNPYQQDILILKISNSGGPAHYHPGGQWDMELEEAEALVLLIQNQLEQIKKDRALRAETINGLTEEQRRVLGLSSE